MNDQTTKDMLAALQRGAVVTLQPGLELAPVAAPPSVVVHGIYIDHTLQGFRYRYTCTCGRDFTCGAPELNAPALCHQCFTGGRSRFRDS